jgi:hypothetical protein
VSRTPELPAFQQYQYAFTRHIRDPKNHPRPAGVPVGRMQVYAELVYNNMEGFLLACFPVLRRVLGKRRWAALVRDFFIAHRCRTPLFRQVPDEFIQYLQQERGARPQDPPYLVHLAHYEWIELALSVSAKSLAPEHIDPQGDMLQGRPALNPVLELLSYPYAVQRIGPKYKPTEAEQETTWLLVFRDLQDEVRFVVLNPVAARLLELLQDGAASGEQPLRQVAAEIAHPDPDAVVAAGLEILEDLQAQQAILGTTRAAGG